MAYNGLINGGVNYEGRELTIGEVRSQDPNSSTVVDTPRGVEIEHMGGKLMGVKILRPRDKTWRISTGQVLSLEDTVRRLSKGDKLGWASISHLGGRSYELKVGFVIDGEGLTDYSERVELD